MKNTPDNKEVLINILIGITCTLEKIRDTTFNIESQMTKLQDRLDNLERENNKKDYNSFQNRVQRWLKHTKK